MENGRNIECAERCLDEALALFMTGKFDAAASLFRATARYLEGDGNRPGKVVMFPSLQG